MKKDSFKKITAGVALGVASVGLVACGGEPTIKDYSFDHYDSSYTTNETFSVDGIVLNLEMSDGTTKEIHITPSMVKAMPDMTTAGEKTIVILYEGKEYSFKINVTAPAPAPTVVSGVVSGYKSAYDFGETFSLTGLKLTLTKSDNSTQEITVTQNMIETMPNMNVAGLKTVVVNYDGEAYSFSFRVYEDWSLASYEFTNVVTQYEAGAELNIVGGILTINYTGGKDINDQDRTKTVVVDALDNSMIKNAPDMSTAGKKNVFVEYNGVTYTFEITVVAEDEEDEPTVEGYEITGIANDGYYDFGSSLELEDLVLTLNMSDGTDVVVDEITESMIVNAPNMTIPGAYESFISYNGELYKFTIKVCSQWGVKTVNYTGNTQFEVGDDIAEKLIGQTFTVVMSRNMVDKEEDTFSASVTITANMIKSVPDNTTVGYQKDVIIEYFGHQYSFKLDILPNAQMKMLDKLQEFYNKYLEYQETASVNVTVTGTLDAKLLNSSASLNIDNTDNPLILNKDMLSDDLTQDVYKALVDSIVKSSLDGVNLEDINLEAFENGEWKTKLDMLKVLNFAAINLQNINYYGYVMNSIFPEEDSYYVELVSSYIWNNLLNNGGTGGENTSSTGYAEVNEFVEKYFTKIKKGVSIDTKQVLEELSFFIENYFNENNGYTTTYKQVYLDMIDSILEEEGNYLTRFIESIFENAYIIETAEYVKVETVEAFALQEKYKTNFVNFVRILENGIGNLSFTKEDLASMINSLNLVNETSLEILDNEWSLFNVLAEFEYGLFPFTYYTQAILTEIDYIANNGIVKYLQDSPLLDSVLISTTGMTDVQASVVKNAVIDLITNPTAVNYDRVVGDIATVLGLDATTLYEIFDMVITVAPVENPSYEYSVAIKDLALALADYLDHIDEDGFNLYTFTNLVNTKLTVFNDAYNAYLGNGGQQIEGFEVFGILQMITTVDPSITEAEFTYKVLLNNVVSMFTPMINEGLTNIGATEDEIETINTLINDIINDTSSVNLQRFAELAKIMLQFADEDIFGNAGYYELDPNSPNSNIFVSITDDNVSEIIMNMFRNILTYLETEEQPTQKGILDIMHATFVEVEAEMNRVNENLLQNNHGDYYTWKLYTVDLLNHLTDTNLSTVDQLKQFAKGYAIELSRLIAMSLQETLGVKEENLNNLYQFVNNNVNSYLDNNFELPYFLMNMMQFINQNCDEDHKTVFNTVATYYIIKNYDSLVQAFPEGTDMDAIFESFMDLELPDGITDIDYNKLVSQLQDPENWMNKLVIEEVETQHVLDQNGLMKEVIVFNVSTNLDIGLEEVDLSVVKLLSNFQITVELTM